MESIVSSASTPSEQPTLVDRINSVLQSAATTIGIIITLAGAVIAYNSRIVRLESTVETNQSTIKDLRTKSESQQQILATINERLSSIDAKMGFFIDYVQRKP